MMQPTAHVPLPDVTFADATPVSNLFGDVYFSKHGGVAETEHVFLRGNGLPEGWAGRAHFTIGELGFGTGLNFLTAWRAFMQTTEPPAQLHYIAIEKFPLTKEMLRMALAMQPELAPQAEALLANYPPRLPGMHRIHLPRATLTLCYGDAADMLPQLDTAVDAWFLDGFAPAKNPDMWSEEILDQIARLSAPDARLATFTAAGSVKRGLQMRGFTMEKTPGYGHKRDMLVGRWEEPIDECAGVPPPTGGRLGGGHRETQRSITPPPQPSPYGGGGILRVSSTLVLGGGIAGCSVARSLAERGYEVTLLERGAIAGGASGNPAAVLFPPLHKRWTAAMDWYFAAYHFTLRRLAQWRDAGLTFGGEALGMLRLPRHAEEETAWREMQEMLGLDPAIAHWVERQEASAHAGLELMSGGVWFPHGAWVSPPELCHALADHPRITVRTGVEAKTLRYQDEKWSVTTADGETFTAATCCVTAAQESAKFLADYGIRLNAVAGQVSVIRAADTTLPLRTVLCHKGYVIPHEEHYLIGATYHRGADAAAVTAANHEANIAELENFLPEWFSGVAVSGRTSFRATTPDRLPYVGQIAPGLFVSTGHGSRGMISAPLAAEVIASQLSGEQVPLSERLRRAINPLRFG